MDLNRMGQGERIAAVGGLALFISLFLAWFGDVSGWEGQTTTDLYLAITAAVAVGAAVGLGFAFPGVTMNGATALLGAVATILMLWLVLFDWPDGIDRGIGVFIALVASAAIAYGGYTAAD
jgi:hypothetical protein